ncbi:MAG: glycosyltransferase [Actinomycetota bacterium]
MTRVLLVIKGLGRGGAEQLLLSAAPYLDAERLEYQAAYVLPWKDALVSDLSRYMPVTVLGDDRGRGWIPRLRALLSTGRFNVVHVHSPVVATALRLSRPRGTKLVYTEHNVWSRYRLATRLANRLSYARNDHVFTVSEEVRRSIRPLPMLRLPPVEVLHHGLDLHAARGWLDPGSVVHDLGLPAGGPVVVTVANFKAHKAHDVLIAAFGEVAAAVPEAKLLLVGQGPEEPRIRDLVARSGLTSKVRFAGFRPDAPAIVAGSDLFVLPSSMEGLPIALLEAMWLGKPVVATSVGGVPEVVTDGIDGCLVEPGDAGALATAIVRVLRDPRLATSLGERAHATAARWDIRHAVRRMEQVYEELTG